MPLIIHHHATRDVLAVGAILATAASTHAAAVIRHFEFGESDMNASMGPAQVGDRVASTRNRLGETLLPDDPFQMDLHPTAGSRPTYVEGRSGPGSLAIAFDNSTNDQSMSAALEGKNFCSFCPDPDSAAVILDSSGGAFASTFSLGKQIWVKPDPAGIGREQVVVIDGAGQFGGVGINAQGNWVHIWSETGRVRFIDTGVAVNFDTWTHVAHVVHGVPGFFYLDGMLVDVQTAGLGFGGSSEPLSVGRQDTQFIGAVDDLKLMVTSEVVDGFDPRTDLDIFEDSTFSGIAGDINQDGLVNQDDVDIWSANAGFKAPISPVSVRPDLFGGFARALAENNPGALLLGDANQNGIIDLADFSLIKHAAAAQGNVVIPEPGHLALISAAVGIMLVRPQPAARASRWGR